MKSEKTKKLRNGKSIELFDRGTTIGGFVSWLSGIRFECPIGLSTQVTSTKALLEQIDGIELNDEDYELLLWPPDIFAIVASVLRASAGYLKLSNRWPPTRKRLKELQISVPQNVKQSKAEGEYLLGCYTKHMRRVGMAWRAAANSTALYLPPDPSGKDWKPEPSKIDFEIMRHRVAKLHPMPPIVETVRKRIPKELVFWWKVVKRLSGFNVAIIGLPTDSPEFELDTRIAEVALNENEKKQECAIFSSNLF